MRRASIGQRLCLLTASATLLWARAAFADAAAAEALFREGRKLLDEGSIDAACSKLAESQAQDASSGTLLNLALCHEKQGKLATAWAEYAAAARLASAQGRAERADVATKQAAALERRLPRMTIRCDAKMSDLKIMRGRESLGAGAVGTAVPVDPGSHVITAMAAGYRSWTTTIEIGEGESKTVDVPALEAEIADASLVVSPRPSALPDPGRDAEVPRAAPLTGWVVGGAGVVALGVGGAFGLTSLAAYGEADRKCPSHRDCEESVRSTRDRAEVQAWVANVSLGIGVLGLAAGAYLVLTGRRHASPAPTSLRVAPRAGGGAMLERSF